MPWVAAIAAVAGGVIGNMSSAADRAAAQAAAKMAFTEIQNVGAPPDLSGEILLKYLASVGVLTPEMEHEVKRGVAQVISEDPTLRDSGMKSLDGLEARSKTGLTAEDRAAYNAIRSKVQGDVEAKRQQIMQNFMARGQGGSGAELASALSANQSGADRASEEGDRISADASKRALEALVAGGQLSTQMRGQDFQVAKANADYQTRINEFNDMNAINRQTRNTAARNSAAATNLAEKQRIADYNTQLANAETQRQQAAKRQYWQDSMARGTAMANAHMGQATQYNNNANDTAKTWAGVGAGVSAGVGAYANNQTQQDWLEEYKKRTAAMSAGGGSGNNGVATGPGIIPGRGY